MSITDAFRQFLTKPAELLMEVIYAIGLLISADPGIPVIFLSLVINIPALYLYRRADSLHALSENKKAGTSRSFSKPVISAAVPFSLLLEILLFAASYLFFNNPYRIWGGSFLSVQNLGKPDALLGIGTVRLSLLPVCAFAVRIIADRIRLKNAGRGIRVRNLLTAFLFFGFTYASLSAFALYRLAGELVYLISVLFPAPKNIRWILSIGISVLGPVFSGYELFFVHPELSGKIPACIGLALLMQIPLAVCIILKIKPAPVSAEMRRKDRYLFLINAVYLTILTGILIPSTVIRSAPTDFISAADYHSPLRYVFSTFLLAAGTFILWFGIIYRLIPSRGKRMAAFVMTVISVWETVNSMFWGNGRGVMTKQLQYEKMPSDTVEDILVNSLVLVLIVLVLILIRKKQPVLLSFMIPVLCVTKTVSSVVNMADIVKTLNTERAALTEQADSLPEIPLSRQGKNVVFFMLDRSIGYFIPFMMAERPELAEKFDGFTYYPNTLSFGTHTNEAAPALFGGYEYTPDRINARGDVSLAEKHDEALRLLPDALNARMSGRPLKMPGSESVR